MTTLPLACLKSHNPCISRNIWTMTILSYRWNIANDTCVCMCMRVCVCVYVCVYVYVYGCVCVSIKNTKGCVRRDGFRRWLRKSKQSPKRLRMRPYEICLNKTSMVNVYKRARNHRINICTMRYCIEMRNNARWCIQGSNRTQKPAINCNKILLH